jgi:hypothetical protein
VGGISSPEPAGRILPGMARHVSAPEKHTGSINYRCGILERQLEGLRLALIGFTRQGGAEVPRAKLQAIRDQLDLLEASLPDILDDQQRWRAECEARNGPPG